MRTPIAAILAMTAWGAVGGVASADTPTNVYSGRIEERIADAKKLYRRHKAAFNRAMAASPAGARPKGIDQDNAAAVTRIAALAIKTKVEGAEAGLVVAPRVLLGDTSASARAWDITIAALEGDRVRLGTSVRRSFGKRLISAEDVGLPPCEFDEAKYRQTLQNTTDDFDAVCQVLATAPRPTDAKRLRLWVQAQVSCTNDSPAGLPTGLDPVASAVARSNLVARVTTVVAEVAALNGDATTPTALLSSLVAVQPSVGVLDSLLDNLPDDTSCRDDDEVSAAVLTAQWARSVRTLGVSLHGDFLPLKFGFNPSASTDKPEELPKGQLAKSEVRFELRQSCGRWTWTAGLGGTMSRSKPADDFALAIKPSLGFELVAFRLDGEAIEDEKGKVNLTKDGELPAYVVLGLDASVGVTLNPDESQEDRVESVNFTAFADFKITEELAFRIGVPVEAELVEREAIEVTMTPAKKARQWTVPVFLATVIKI